MRAFRRLALATLSGLVVLTYTVANAGPTPGPSSGPGSGPNSWNDHWWIEKASRALRGGDPLSSSENADALLAQGRDQAVASFLKDPRFGDTVLDFSLMFLGFRKDRIKKENGTYIDFPADSVYDFPQAIHASQEVAKDGDFFRIFDLYQPIYAGPLERPYSFDPADQSLSDDALRAKYLQGILDDLDRLIALAPKVTPTTQKDFCADQLATHLLLVSNGLLRIPVFSFPDTFVALFTRDWYGSLEAYCGALTPIPGFDLVTALQSAKAKDVLLFSEIQKFNSATYDPKTVANIATIDLSSLAPGYQITQFKNPQLTALTNSSTNYNRKRSAYILKKFFCDDLNPIGVQFPAVHAAGKHGNDAACFACHYKLDPMAGFFRNYGQVFIDFSKLGNKITFDDTATADLKTYEQNWAGGPDAEHPLNIGYIRSTKDLTQNFYGSSLEDLYAYLKVAPEVRRCIMKRAYEYLVSDDQTVDGDYLDYLTDQFNQDIAMQGSSGVALKNAFARIVLGPGFSTPNIDRNTCYDHKPGYVPSGGVPCQVSSILNKSCVGCHSSTQDSGGLDLAHWEASKGDAGGFPHVNGHGKPISHAATFQMILDRLNATNPDVRMPYLKDMLTADRQQLYLWANGMLTGKDAAVK